MECALVAVDGYLGESTALVHAEGEGAAPCHGLSRQGVSMKELDLVVLTRDLPAHGLKAGDVGTIVYAAEAVDSFEVEFVRADGHTVALLSLERLPRRRPLSQLCPPPERHL